MRQLNSEDEARKQGGHQADLTKRRHPTGERKHKMRRWNSKFNDDRNHDHYCSHPAVIRDEGQ